MNSTIIHGEVMHARKSPRAHAFRYPVYVFGFDLDELGQLDQQISGFGVNRRAMVSLREADHLGGGPGSLRSRVEHALHSHGIHDPIERVVLITSARVLGYVFNPVSFYFCHGAEGRLIAMLAEVNNTFGDTHLYVLSESLPPRRGFVARFRMPKEFHVSPFMDMAGEYEIHVADPGERLEIHFNILRDERVIFASFIRGTPKPLTTGALWRTLARYPLRASMTMPRILFQAARLHYEKRLPVYTRPHPTHSMTLRKAAPRWRDRVGASVFKRQLEQTITRGRLSVILPDGERWKFGGQLPGTDASIEVRDCRFFGKVLTGADLGFGEAWIAGDWTSPDLVAVLSLLIDNFEVVHKRSPLSRALGRVATALRSFVRRNSLVGSRRNIAEHYDLGNDFFRTFLDPSMTYSCALFESADDTLEQAQLRKIDALLDKAHLESHHHLLEIGSGWGALALRAVERFGCRVTTITLSQEQHDEVRKRIAAAGAEDKIDVRLCDYRNMTGTFDRIISVEMLEAVGHENYGTYFGACDRLLAADGLAVLQVITIPDQRYDAYRANGDFIERFVFPGSLVPSLKSLQDAMAKDSRFVLESVANIGPHYAPTLRAWREAFHREAHRVRALGFDERFVRLWDYYLAYCEAGFERRILNNLHLVLTRPSNPTLALNLTRQPSVPALAS